MAMNLSKKEIEIILTLRDEASKKVKSFRADIKEFNSATKDALQPLLLMRNTAMKVSLAIGFIALAASKGIGFLQRYRKEIESLDVSAIKLGMTSEELSKKIYGFNIGTGLARLGGAGLRTVEEEVKGWRAALGKFFTEYAGSTTLERRATPLYMTMMSGISSISAEDQAFYMKRAREIAEAQLLVEDRIRREKSPEALAANIELTAKVKQLADGGLEYKKYLLEQEVLLYGRAAADKELIAKYHAEAVERIEEDRTLTFSSLAAARLKTEGRTLEAMQIEQRNALVAFKRQYGADGEMVREYVRGQQAMYKAAKMTQLGIKNNAQIMQGGWNSLIGSMTSTFSNVFYNTITGQIKSLKDVFNDFGKAVLKNLSDMIAQYMVAKAIMGIGSIFSGWGTISGGVGGSVISTGPQSIGGHSFTQAWSPYHRGGMVRAHSGLAVDEVPIIAQSGERILSRRQNRQYEDMVSSRGAERTNVTYNIYAIDAASFVAMCMRNPEGIHAVMQDAKRRDLILAR